MKYGGLAVWMLAASTMAAENGSAVKTYRNVTFGVQFQYPARWVVSECQPDSDPFCVTVYRRQSDVGSDAYVASFEFSKLPLDKAAEKSGFSRQEDHWFREDSFAGGVAEEISGPGWTGLRVITACGVNDDKGDYHAAGGECFTAILSNGNRSVQIDSVHTGLGPAPGPQVEAILESVRFRRPVKK